MVEAARATRAKLISLMVDLCVCCGGGIRRQRSETFFSGPWRQRPKVVSGLFHVVFIYEKESLRVVLTTILYQKYETELVIFFPFFR